jgi:hypothetical protein
VTADEEFNKLEDDIRRLKIEYEVYFNGASPRAPHDTLFRVETLIKRYSSDQSKLSFSQRFRFNTLAQKYAVNSQLWRRRLQEKEEGRYLHSAPRRQVEAPVSGITVRVIFSNPDTETDKVEKLLRAMQEARRLAGERDDGLDVIAFRKFIRDKTQQIKDTLDCDKVQFSVSVEGGKVKFKATKAE